MLMISLIIYFVIDNGDYQYIGDCQYIWIPLAIFITICIIPGIIALEAI